MPTSETIALCAAGALALFACLFVVSFGCRSILSLCGDLERDRRNGYKVRPCHNARQCQQYLRRAAK